MIMRFRTLRFFFFIVLTTLIFSGKEAYCAENSANTPIHVEADRMESIQKDNAVLFTGNVEAKQGELVINSDRMTVYYPDSKEKRKSGEQSQKIKKLVAAGNVEIQNEGWIATGDNVEYFESERKALLTGNTKVWQDNNMVTGERIWLYLDEGKSIVERGSKNGERVKAFFYPGGENNKEQPTPSK